MDENTVQDLDSGWEDERAAPQGDWDEPETPSQPSQPALPADSSPGEGAEGDGPANAGPASPPQPALRGPLLRQVQARKRDFALFLRDWPGVEARDIPRQVWAQVAKGTPLGTAYAMHENRRLRAELAAERQNAANRARTPGALSGGGGWDEIDRLWAEDD